eukprot:438229_1
MDNDILQYQSIEETKHDTDNNIYRYLVKCSQKINSIGIYVNDLNVTGVFTDHARKVFRIPSRILRINDTILDENTSLKTISEHFKFARMHPGSIIELQSSKQTLQQGIHFQLNINDVIVENIFVQPTISTIGDSFKQVTCPLIEDIMSKICLNKKVQIYDIIRSNSNSEHCRGPILFGFINDTAYECQSILNNIKQQLSPYNKLKADICKIFQRRSAKKNVKPRRYFSWNLEQVRALSVCLSDANNNQFMVACPYLENIYKTKYNMQQKTDKNGVREIISSIMAIYVSLKYRLENLWRYPEENYRFCIYELQLKMWLGMMTNWFWGNNIFDGLTSSEFIHSLWSFFRDFCDDIENHEFVQSDKWNPNLAVFGIFERIHE